MKRGTVMDTKQLTTFQVAAECLNFTQTAEKLHFAQSSVTAQIQALEKEVGQSLFVRVGRRLKLTDSGAAFKAYADQVIALTQDMKHNLAHPGSPSMLTIGATESQCTYRLPAILTAYKQHYPTAKLLIKPTNFAAEVKEQLAGGDIDLGFVMGKCPRAASLSVKPLIAEEIWLVAGANHPMARKKMISLKQIEKETFILTAKGCAYRALLEQAFTEHGVYPRNIIEFVTVEAIKQCALAGLGLAYLPAVVVRADVESGRLVKMHWFGAPRTIPTFIAWHKGRELADNERYFIERACSLIASGKSSSGDALTQSQ
jgi:DNA-binding transcriptional LysR family regulator